MQKNKWNIFGVGINDVDYTVFSQGGDGKKRICPYYDRWRRMLSRCYEESVHENSRGFTYKDCTVCEDWWRLSQFKAWMETQDWEGKELDKDLLVEGNKVYSPDTCIFVTKRVNAFMTGTVKPRGFISLTGVSICRSSKKNPYKAYCVDPSTNERVYLGLYPTELEAHLA